MLLDGLSKSKKGFTSSLWAILPFKAEFGLCVFLILHFFAH